MAQEKLEPEPAPLEPAEERKLPPPLPHTGPSAASSADKAPEPEPELEQALAEPPAEAPPLEPPPKRRHVRTRPAGVPRKRAAPSLADRLYETLGSIRETPDGTPYYTGAAGLVALLDPFDASCIAFNSRQVADAWGALAEQSERVRLALEWALSGGAWGAAVLSLLPMLLPIAAHHGLLPDTIFGYGASAQSAAAGDGAPAGSAHPEPGTGARG